MRQSTEEDWRRFVGVHNDDPSRSRVNLKYRKTVTDKEYHRGTHVLVSIPSQDVFN